ncbi:NCS2 family permease [Ruminococcus gauvreauii]|uniref:NCS2 family permease n=1 Tax=Ruminococcus gauvreauii TaxID=438033 RepID=A0ABY5VM72_9FIRM|nr:NCS2 family permease [Ruminococcus gauvreauii]UWP61228.1 NCS2 family permease [Ruminococcus gauvreauii]
MEKLFKLKEHNTTVRTEITAGITTFLTMAYILAVNPNLLGASGMDAGAVFTATALASALATCIMALWANYPLVLSASMGLNAYFTYTVCLQDLKGIEDPWRIALTAVFIEGIIFILLSFFKLRETIANSVSANLKYGITAGIGLFIALIGLKSSGVVVANEATLVSLGDISSPQMVLCLAGVLIIAVMNHFHVKASILWGILITWGLGILAQLSGWYAVTADQPSLIPSFTAASLIPPSIAPTFFKFNFPWAAKHLSQFIVILFSFLFVDMFDTIGTAIGVADKANLLDKDGNLPKAGRVLTSDAIGTVAGSIMGTSTITSFVESSSGVAEGGRTGLTALTSGILFIAALFLSPVFLAIPSFATAPALIMVGFFMASSIRKMDFDSDVADAVGGYLAFLLMPLTYSVATGIMFAMLAWFIIKLCTGQVKKIHPVMYIVCALFIVRVMTLVLSF